MFLLRCDSTRNPSSCLENLEMFFFQHSVSVGLVVTYINYTVCPFADPCSQTILFVAFLTWLTNAFLTCVS